jgi:hypothetical protein
MHDDARDAMATLVTIRAARETGVLDALLDSADTVTDIADETAVDERTASVLLDVLADRGFFEFVDGAPEPTNRALGLLTKTDLRSIGRVPHDADRFHCCARLPETLATARDSDTAEVPAVARDERPADYERNQLGFIQATPDATVSAAVSAAIRAAPGATNVLDVGGAPGPYATEFAARGKTVTLRDVPDRLDAARPLLEPRAVRLDPGELTAGLPTADLAFATDLTPRLDDTALASAANAIHDALTRPNASPAEDANRPDEALVLVEHVRERSARTPTHRIDALATGQPGDHRTEPALRETLHGAGFDAVDVHAVPGLERHAVVAAPRRT